MEIITGILLEVRLGDILTMDMGSTMNHLVNYVVEQNDVIMLTLD